MVKLPLSLLTLNLAVCSALLLTGKKVDSSIGPEFARFGRREFVGSLAVIGSTVFSPNQSIAAVSQEQKDKENIVKGYRRLQYLLDNWEAETTVCKTGQETTFGDRCERTPLKVMDYLGFKNINDPLFKADNAMLRLRALVPTDKEVDFYEAVEQFADNAEEASSMAFVSSWGEANPGGGKDRVKLFIERSKNNVIKSRDSLKTVIDILKLEA
eukprot:scaffold1398_cov116-Cylindrotheca_fusiformis.AAC.8